MVLAFDSCKLSVYSDGRSFIYIKPTAMRFILQLILLFTVAQITSPIYREDSNGTILVSFPEAIQVETFNDLSKVAMVSNLLSVISTDEVKRTPCYKIAFQADHVLALRKSLHPT